MKTLLKLLLITVLFTACKNETKTESTVIEDVKASDITTSIYPDNVTKVFMHMVV